MIKKEDSLRGIFYITKGQYFPTKKSAEDRVSIQCYNPEDENTVEWYRVIDRKTRRCIYASSDYNKALNRLHDIIFKYRTYSKYSEVMCDSFSTPISSAQKRLEESIDRAYGDYYSDDIGCVEEETYIEVSEDTLLNRARKRVKKVEGMVTYKEKSPIQECKDNSQVGEVKFRKFKPLPYKHLDY